MSDQDISEQLSDFLQQEHEEQILNFTKRDEGFEVDLEALYEFNENAVDALVNNPDEYTKAIKLALQQSPKNSEPFDNIDGFKIYYNNLPDKYYIPIREIRSEHINKLVGIRGLASKSTRVRPKVKAAKFVCDNCGEVLFVEQDKDEITHPNECPDCEYKTFTVEPGESRTEDYQKIELKESPDDTEGGETPETINFQIEGEKTGIVLTGRRVEAVGVLRAKIVKKSTVLMTYLEGNTIELEEGRKDDERTEEDLERMREIAARDDTLQYLSKSVAPGIEGYSIPKQGVVTQLFSGVDKTVGDNIRGNIHSLWVGDPGTGKSQVLDYASDLLPNGVSTSGKGSSAAGLTAAVVSDKDFAGEDKYTLKAGALVLADGGIACVDELDKMTDNDRSALHQALEQQQISVNKAGINATLQSRCSMFAAANPKHGRFEDFGEDYISQIDLPPALISRFDLIFVIRDELDEDKDRDIAEKILENNIAGEENVRVAQEYQGSGETLDKLPSEDMSDPNPDAISKELFRKYILYARQNIFPKLTDEARQEIVDRYAEIRGKGDEDTYPITHRKLEAMIRITEAIARLNLREEARLEDAKKAISIIMESMRQVGMNEEGEYDADKIETGTSSVQRDRIKSVERAIKAKSEEKEEEGKEDTTVTKEEIIEYVDGEENKIKQELEKLSMKGEIYNPAGKDGYCLT